MGHGADASVTRRDESAQAARVLAWGYVFTFMFLSSVARAFYSSQGAEPSARFELLCYMGLLTLLWHLVRSEGRVCGASFPMDLGFFAGFFSFLVMPLMLWGRQRWYSVGKMGLLFVAWLAGHGLSVGLHHAIVWFQ